MLIHDIYPRMNDTINEIDLKELKQPLTIKEIEVSGETKKTVKFTFEETSLKHRANKTEVIDFAQTIGTNDTKDFKGKKVTLVSVDGKVKVKV